MIKLYNYLVLLWTWIWIQFLVLFLILHKLKYSYIYFYFINSVHNLIVILIWHYRGYSWRKSIMMIINYQNPSYMCYSSIIVIFVLLINSSYLYSNYFTTSIQSFYWRFFISSFSRTTEHFLCCNSFSSLSYQISFECCFSSLFSWSSCYSSIMSPSSIDRSNDSNCNLFSYEVTSDGRYNNIKWYSQEPDYS